MATLTTDRYARTSAGIQWSVPGSFETTFRWEYQDGRDSLLKLYDKGKQRQWDADTRIDWSQDLDPENPRAAARRVDPDLRLAAVANA